MLQKSLVVCVAILLAISGRESRGQHCAPIVESYLQSVSIQRSETGIVMEINYRKTGGQNKDAYQAYVVAYPASKAEQIHSLTPQMALADRKATVVHTQLAKRQDDGSYRIQWAMDANRFVEQMLNDEHLDRQQIQDLGGWKSFQEKICLAVFIPFLEDAEYSIVEGLPEDKHECNYLQEAALLFEPLSPTLSVHFGIVQGVEIPDQQYRIQFNGHRPIRQPANESSTEK